jgi:hypothetical protein
MRGLYFGMAVVCVGWALGTPLVDPQFVALLALALLLIDAVRRQKPQVDSECLGCIDHNAPCKEQFPKCRIEQ